MFRIRPKFGKWHLMLPNDPGLTPVTQPVITSDLYSPKVVCDYSQAQINKIPRVSLNGFLLYPIHMAANWDGIPGTLDGFLAIRWNRQSLRVDTG